MKTIVHQSINYKLKKTHSVFLLWLSLLPGGVTPSLAMDEPGEGVPFEQENPLPPQRGVGGAAGASQLSPAVYQGGGDWVEDEISEHFSQSVQVQDRSYKRILNGDGQLSSNYEERLAFQASHGDPNIEIFYEAAWKKTNALGNFYQLKNKSGSVSSFEISGMPWTTVEQFFQAAKFGYKNRSEVAERAFQAIRAAKSSRDMIAIARQYDQPGNSVKRSDFDQVKDRIMCQAVHAKFSQWRVLQRQYGSFVGLCETGSRILIEDSWGNDAYWGNGLQESYAPRGQRGYRWHPQLDGRIAELLKVLEATRVHNGRFVDVGHYFPGLNNRAAEVTMSVRSALCDVEFPKAYLGMEIRNPCDFSRDLGETWVVPYQAVEVQSAAPRMSFDRMGNPPLYNP